MRKGVSTLDEEVIQKGRDEWIRNPMWSRNTFGCGVDCGDEKTGVPSGQPSLLPLNCCQWESGEMISHPSHKRKACGQK
jgi:hypothetical protein